MLNSWILIACFAQGMHEIVLRNSSYVPQSTNTKGLVNRTHYVEHRYKYERLFVFVCGPEMLNYPGCTPCPSPPHLPRDLITVWMGFNAHFTYLKRIKRLRMNGLLYSQLALAFDPTVCRHPTSWLRRNNGVRRPLTTELDNEMWPLLPWLRK